MRADEIVVIVESKKVKKLRESVHKELRHQITLLERSFNQNIEPGRQYIPVPVYIVQDHMDTFKRNPNALKGEFCELIAVTAEAFEFKDKAGNMVEWPNQKHIGISYMTTILAQDVETYNKIRTMFSLIFNLAIPPSTEE